LPFACQDASFPFFLASWEHNSQQYLRLGLSATNRLPHERQNRARHGFVAKYMIATWEGQTILFAADLIYAFISPKRDNSLMALLGSGSSPSNISLSGTSPINVVTGQSKRGGIS
jgi:hypothetical protein